MTFFAPRRPDPLPSAALAGLLTVSLFAPACVFKPPPALPEEIAAKEEEERLRAGGASGGGSSDPSTPEGTPEQADPARFAEGQEPEVGMTFAEMKAFATAQGDPEGGDFTLEEALADLPAGGELWVSMVMDAGSLECQLFENKTPRTVANFVGLARGLRASKDPRSGEWSKRNYYDGTDFHRVIEGFMIQGGDPTGSGRGNPGYVIPDEFDPSLRHDKAGLLSMANRGPGTGAAQFFITLNPTPHLDDKHAIFGECTAKTIERAEAIAATGDEGNRPKTRQTIRRMVIERRGAVETKGESKPESKSKGKSETSGT